MNNYSPLIKHLKEWLHRKRLSLQLQLVLVDNSEYDQKKVTTMNGLVNPKLARLNLEPISATHKGF
jgi:hypothetical protein